MTYRKYDTQSDELNFEFLYNPEETKELHQRLNRNPTVNIDDLRRVALWKIDRVLGISERTIGLLRKIATAEGLSINDDLVREVIQELVGSQGIGFPMASAMLKFVRPDVFPIIDVRAYRAYTGKKPYYSTYTYEIYAEYTEALTALADKEGRPLQQMDEQLYCFDIEHNGKI